MQGVLQVSCIAPKVSSIKTSVTRHRKEGADKGSCQSMKATELLVFPAALDLSWRERSTSGGRLQKLWHIAP